MIFKVKEMKLLEVLKLVDLLLNRGYLRRLNMKPPTKREKTTRQPETTSPTSISKERKKANSKNLLQTW